MIETKLPISRIESLAQQKLDELKEADGKMTFPIDPFRLLDMNDVVIRFSNFDKLEGLLLYEKDKTSFVGINVNRPISRQRFTAAHELGHIVLHTSGNNNNFLCPINGSRKSIENEADRFSSFLLMPTTELLRQVDKYKNCLGKVGLNECLYIAEYFGVSFESCVKTIAFRIKKFEADYNNEELDKLIKAFKPASKRRELLKKTNDLELLRNSINYSYFSIINVGYITGIRFVQNLVYHENRLENVEITAQQVNDIYADFRIKGNKSEYCKEKNQNIIEALGNIEMNRYCLETEDKINVFKIQDLHKLLYKYSPYPEYAGTFKKEDNIILHGKRQPISASRLLEELANIDNKINELITNIDKYNISDYIEEVAMLHYKITIMHPFQDGNGRVSRGFLNWLLRLKKLPPIYIDTNEKKEYLDALNKIDTGGDSEDLQIIIIKAMIRTMVSIHENWQ